MTPSTTAPSANTTSRRRLLLAAPAAVLVAAVSAVSAVAGEEPAEADTFTREEYDADCTSAAEVAYLYMARAWVDRWKALGGDFGLSFNNDGTVRGVLRGMICGADLWAPTDQGREDIRPHTWLTREEHHDGAVKALEGLLELVPGLREAVREIAGREAYARFGRQQEA